MKKEVFMKEIGAHLKKLSLSSENPEKIAEFYAQAYKLDLLKQGNTFVCEKEQVRLEFTAGESGQLSRVDYTFNVYSDFENYKSYLKNKIVINNISDSEFIIQNPLGHIIGFSFNESERSKHDQSPRLQHFGIRAVDINSLSDFYEHTLGFTISDRVYNEQQELTAIFIRTNQEHHSFAIFKSPINRFDHFSCEVRDWSEMKIWADHMATSSIELAWGIGRHGPGNDTFFMIKDSDGNMGEISAELEQCSPDRPVGIWKHHPLTLNQWGVAIMRC